MKENMKHIKTRKLRNKQEWIFRFKNDHPITNGVLAGYTCEEKNRFCFVPHVTFLFTEELKEIIEFIEELNKKRRKEMFGLIMFMILGAISVYAGIRQYKDSYCDSGWGTASWCCGIVAFIFIIVVPISWSMSIGTQADIIAFEEAVKHQPLVYLDATRSDLEYDLVITMIADNPDAVRIVLNKEVQMVNEKIIEFNLENESWLWDWYTYDWDSPELIVLNN